MALSRFKIIIFIFFVLSVIPGKNSFAQVQSDGSFSYSVPIEIPEGRQGIAPNISLDYSSFRGNGTVGVGWKIEGLPAITRVDTGNGIKYNDSDSFGSTATGVMVNIGGGIYHSKNEQFIRYEPKGNCSGPCYWVATDRSGLKFYFGGIDTQNHSSRIHKKVSPAVRVWALARVVDLHGNYYEVDYVNEEYSTGAYYPQKITYTKHLTSDTGTYRTVTFFYEGRPDIERTYYQNAYGELNKRLNRIEVRSNGTLVRKYNLTYRSGGSKATRRSELEKIQEYGSAWGTLPEQMNS